MLLRRLVCIIHGAGILTSSGLMELLLTCTLVLINVKLSSTYIMETFILDWIDKQALRSLRILDFLDFTTLILQI